MKTHLLLHSILILISLTGISCASSLGIRSEPSGATVTIKELGSSEQETLGKTPLQLSSSDLRLKRRPGPYVINISAPDRVEKSLVVPRLDGQDIDLFVTLAPQSPVAVAQSEKFNKLIDDLFRAQSLANQKDLEGALALLNRLAETHPGISAVYELRGSVRILRRELAAALRDYETALNLNPESVEAIRIRKELQSALAGSPPGSSPGSSQGAPQ